MEDDNNPNHHDHQEQEEEDSNIGLGLTLGLGGCGGGYVPKRQYPTKSEFCLDLSFNLCPKEEKEEEGEEEEEEDDDDEERPNNCKRVHLMNINNNNSCRKKLRLSKDQSALLENSFKLHNTLNLAQKHSLAKQLNLTARQVEVWFQNRRARTKLKQTEVDCEFLKKCCESLSDENTRLKKELQELQSLKRIGSSSSSNSHSQLCLHLPMCTSCDQTTPAAFGLGRAPPPHRHQ